MDVDRKVGCFYVCVWTGYKNLISWMYGRGRQQKKENGRSEIIERRKEFSTLQRVNNTNAMTIIDIIIQFIPTFILF